MNTSEHKRRNRKSAACRAKANVRLREHYNVKFALTLDHIISEFLSGRISYEERVSRIQRLMDGGPAFHCEFDEAMNANIIATGYEYVNVGACYGEEVHPMLDDIIDSVCVPASPDVTVCDPESDESANNEAACSVTPKVEDQPKPHGCEFTPPIVERDAALCCSDTSVAARPSSPRYLSNQSHYTTKIGEDVGVKLCALHTKIESNRPVVDVITNNPTCISQLRDRLSIIVNGDKATVILIDSSKCKIFSDSLFSRVVDISKWSQIATFSVLPDKSPNIPDLPIYISNGIDHRMEWPGIHIPGGRKNIHVY